MENYYSYLAFFLTVVFIIKLLHRRNRNSPPSPFCWPIIGHLHLCRPPLYKALEALSLRYGPILSLKLGCRSFLVVSSPSAVEECFTKNDRVFANRPRIMAGDYLSYNYTALALAPYGHSWRSLRRFAAVEIFSQTSLQKSSIIRREEVNSLLRHVFKASRGKPNKVQFSLRYLLSLLTVNIVTRMVTGEPYVGEEAAGTDVGKQRLESFLEIYFSSLIINMCDFFPALRWIGYKGLEKSIIRLQAKRDEFFQRLIEESKQKQTSSLSASNLVEVEKERTMIESLLSLRESEPEFYSDDVIKGMILTMYIAGSDTSETTLEWAISLLLNHPDVLQKVRAEIDDQVGHGRLLNELDLARLPYLHCVINETLRLFPTVPLLLPHFSTEDCTVGGFQIPRGTTLLVNAWFLHRDPKLWEEPTRFKPERFEATNRETDGFKFVPFGIGRRSCPGAGMGQRIISLALGALIQCFDWERPGKEMVDMKPDTGGSALRKAKPLEAVCSPRHSMDTVLSQL
ncbi:Cytochrome P450 81D11 [Morella rubra]|uniref:Cytochrome P450 81D11 n=1 Tax=Morella rubra TaxID=262757 RepID=A0A6A1W519_9ROSI|nr:Cytochrome P450 81D11 [Morella rubra]